MNKAPYDEEIEMKGIDRGKPPLASENIFIKYSTVLEKEKVIDYEYTQR